MQRYITSKKRWWQDRSELHERDGIEGIMGVSSFAFISDTFSETFPSLLLKNCPQTLDLNWMCPHIPSVIPSTSSPDEKPVHGRLQKMGASNYVYIITSR
jgi:hypothetical protein